MENIILYSSKVLLSESESNPDVFIAKFCICDFDFNKNSVGLNRDTIETWMSTLKNKPLVGKIKLRSDGELDFSGHNAIIVEKIDENGNTYQDLEFDTNAFCTFTDVSIEIIDGVECIVATAEIWKRFTRACEIIQKRIEEGTLHTSWEISVVNSTKKIIGGATKKIINTGRFIGHCLLSKFTEPAYDSSGLLEIASVYEDSELSVALSQDLLEGSNIKNIKEKEEDDLKKDKKIDISEEVTEIENIMPNENTAEEIQATKEEVNEEVIEDNSDENEHIEIVEENTEEVSNTDNNQVGKNTDSEVEKLKSELDTKNDLIIKATEEIQSLKTQISDLVPFKEKFEKAEQERIETEIAESKKNLVSKYEKTGLISKEEFDTSEEIKGYIDSLDESSLKELVATRYMASLEKENIETSEVGSTVEEQKVESASANLNDDEVVDYKSIMKNFLK